uniref:Uncharacterized protein n=1 Tax=Onchocerca volvulus TaxID=6282 RepID=A0A8R1XXV5_ONCVO
MAGIEVSKEQRNRQKSNNMSKNLGQVTRMSIDWKKLLEMVQLVSFVRLWKICHSVSYGTIISK